VGILLAAVIHAGVLAAVLWRAELAPIRERLVRVVLFAPEADTVAVEQPPAAAPLSPVSAATPAIVREPKRPPRPRLSQAAPAPPSARAAPVEAMPAEAPVASAPEPVARETTSARPRYKTNPEPPYPVLARRRRQEGVVLLAVRVDAAGRPETVEIQTSSGFAALDEAAVAAVKTWEFEPGRLGGAPVPSQVEVPIRFQLERD
jgi:protein TonB